MFPNAAGYAAYAGPCDINNPTLSDAVNNSVQVPISLTDTNWLPGGTYTPSLWLSQIRASVNTSGVRAAPTTTAASSTYYHSQALNGSAVVKVRLVSDVESTITTPRCKPATNLYNTWQTLGNLTLTVSVALRRCRSVASWQIRRLRLIPVQLDPDHHEQFQYPHKHSRSPGRCGSTTKVCSSRYRSAVNQGFIADWDDDSPIPDNAALTQTTTVPRSAMWKKRLKDERGMTLIELLTAEMIGGIVITAAIMLVVISFNGSQRVSDRVNSLSAGTDPRGSDRPAHRLAGVSLLR